jgi:Asp-tRNA(Asn)/Glu-tRNA(Gln) amidotransferase B subunit
MSEKDFITKLWKSVVAAIITIVAGALITMLISFQVISERTQENSKRIESITEELKTKANVGDDNGIHLMLLERCAKNEEALIQVKDENKEMLQYLIDKIERVNQNILDLHRK